MRFEISKRTDVVLCLIGVLLLFGALEFLIPLRTTVQIGADEGFELAKATLVLKGYKLYTDIWNDHAPLHTFLVTELLKHVSPSVAGPRLLTVGLAGVLFGAVFMIGCRVGSVEGIGSGAVGGAVGTPRPTFDEKGLLCGVVASVLLIGSPGFLELSSSCMLEIPSLAPAVAGLCVLFYGCVGGLRRGGDTTPYLWRVIIAGVLFGISLGMKLIGVVLLPIAAVVIWAEYGFNRRKQSERREGEGLETGIAEKPGKHRTLNPDEQNRDFADSASEHRTLNFESDWRTKKFGRMFQLLFPAEAVKWFAVLLAVCGVTFAGLDLVIDGGAFLEHFHQSWMSHFARAVSTEYGSPDEHRFPFALLVKNWDLTVPAVVGVVVMVKRGIIKLKKKPAAKERKERREKS